MTRIVLSLLSVFILSSCLGTQPPAPVTHYGEKEGAGSAGVHSVLPGDTLYSISQRYQIALQDIAITNRLGAPFTLYKGQRLHLPPPQTYKVREGDTLYSVSRLFNVTTSQIARQNNLYAPYTIHTGQVLRLPSASAGTQVAQVSVSPKTGEVVKTTKAPTSKPKPRKTKISAKTPKRSSSKFMQPVEGRVISSYGPKKDSLHNDGINIAAPKGTPVKAAENGVVVYAGNELKGSGNLVLVRHEGRWMTAYAHMDKISVKRGAVIKRGQQIGTVGQTGSVDSPQLHFEVRRGTQAINPAKYM